MSLTEHKQTSPPHHKEAVFTAAFQSTLGFHPYSRLETCQVLTLALEGDPTLGRRSRREGQGLDGSTWRQEHSDWVYDEKDPRRARFVGRQKEVNKNFAIKLVAEEPVSGIEARVVSCDGGGGALGHPKVYINLDKETKVGTCGYCGLQFKQTHHH
uniref:NADH dehydrogenase [ubiquinone] iron-sulfur protein 6, mitochondrial n=1 Tax=Hucho hucho TaxID=62062 RepID=A0A4W5NQJ2_9TELE